MGEAKTMPIWKYIVVLLGDSAVGKTCLFDKYVNGPAGTSRDILPSIEEFLVESGTKIVYKDHDRVVRVTIWDTPGLEGNHQNIDEKFCRGHAAIILYDITQRDSLRNAGKWLDIPRGKSTSNCFRALVGNKADLVSEREVSYKVAGCRLQVAGCRLQVVGCRLPVPGRSVLGEMEEGVRAKPSEETSERNVSVGDIVLLKEADAHRNDWPLGRIEEVTSSSDGKVRKAKVKTCKKGNAKSYDRTMGGRGRVTV